MPITNCVQSLGRSAPAHAHSVELIPRGQQSSTRLWRRLLLAAAGAQKVFAEKISGVVTDRKALVKAIGALGAGDVLLVTRLDRLARSTRDLLNVLDAVAKVGAGFRSLADAWADTTTPHGRLMLTVLGGLAEFERELIRSRTNEGRKRAQARGVRFAASSS